MKNSLSLLGRLFFLSLLLASCGLIPSSAIKNPKSDAETLRRWKLRVEEEAPFLGPAASAVKLQLLSSANPGLFHVRVRIETNRLEERASYLMRFSRKSGAAVLGFFEWDRSQKWVEFLDRDLENGQRYHYALVANPQNYVIDPRLSAAVLVPLLLEIKRGERLSFEEVAQAYPDAYSQSGNLRRLQIGSLSLREGALWISQGNDWWIEIDHLESLDAEITSFEAGSSAPRSMSGRSSGKIFLDLNEAHGSLKLSSRGENGGWGYNGFDGHKGRAGAAGRDQWIMSLDSDRRGIIREYCHAKPQWGIPGTPGRDGQSGSDGRVGGDSEGYSLRFKRGGGSALKVTFQSVAGLGGKGGTGGRGGRGGPRVLGRRTKLCGIPQIPKPIRGRDGRNGLHGKNGGPGLGEATLCLANAQGLLGPRCFDPTLTEAF